MKLVIFGATGKTGQHVWRRALEHDHEVTAFTRSVDQIDPGDSNVRVVRGDVMDAESVAAAVAGHDAVIVALGSNGLRDKATLAAGTRNVVGGMARHRVERLVVLSAAGVGESCSERCCGTSTPITRRRRRWSGRAPSTGRLSAPPS